MKRFGILQTALPARDSKRSKLPSYAPGETWRLFYLAGKRHQLEVLFFRSEDVDFQKKRVHAWTCSSRNGETGWRRDWHPLPNVVYENYPLGVRGSGAGVASVKRQFIQKGIPVFNPIFFDKAALDRILRRSQRTKRYLPPSIVAVDTAEVLDFLNKHKVIYLKPVNGSQGNGIIQLTKISTAEVQVRSDKFEGVRLERRMSRSALKLFLIKQLRQRRFLVQKGLHLLQRDNRKIDFRVVVHRGADGKWHTAGIRPKLGRAGAIITNSHGGGSKTTWTELAAWAKRTNTKLPAREKLACAAVSVGEQLTCYRPTLSHLGIDVGVDVNQNIYVLDVNIRPGRDLLTRDMLLKVTDFTAGFASYLAGRIA